MLPAGAASPQQSVVAASAVEPGALVHPREDCDRPGRAACAEPAPTAVKTVAGAPPGSIECTEDTEHTDCPEPPPCLRVRCVQHGDRHWCTRESTNSGRMCSLPSSNGDGTCWSGLCMPDDAQPEACAAYAMRAFAAEWLFGLQSISEVCGLLPAECESRYRHFAARSPASVIMDLAMCGRPEFFSDGVPALPWGNWAIERSEAR